MKTIKTKNYNILSVRKCQAYGDILMETEVINGKEYDIYVGFCGCVYYYAVEKK